MLSILYILFCTALGYILLEWTMPGLKNAGRLTYKGAEIHIPSTVIMLPASWLTGTLMHTWLVYLAALAVVKISPDIRHPLTPANIAAAIISIAVGTVLFIFVLKKREPEHVEYKPTLSMLLILPLALFLSVHFYRTFHHDGDVLKVGYSVFSDFATHVGMIRSFSFGNNIPAQYSHFAGTDIRYHFMFQFLSGNLEYLGLSIDHAFNLASLLSMLSACILLYVYAVKLIGKRMGGILSVLFMLFHSSPSLLHYLSEAVHEEGFFKELWERNEFFAYTTREDWGLWNLKVYMNQRHLAFSMAVVFLALIIFTPKVIALFDKLSECETPSQKLRAFFIDKDGWLPKDIVKPLALGVILGAMAFWNGAMLIGCLSILFLMAFISRNRLEYLITAVVSVILSYIQTVVFIDGKTMNLEFRFGFLADPPTLLGVLRYLVELAWPLPLLIIICLFSEKNVIRFLTIAFSAPMIIAFTLSMVPELAVNHKYIMLSFILFGIPVAGLICRIWSFRLPGRIAAVILCLLLTCTGIFECRILWNLDEDVLVYRDDDPLISWIHENSDSHDIWLTPMYHIARPVVGGAMLYYGWPYYSWGAGYETSVREANAVEMYAPSSSEKLRSLTEQENIRFILVDADVRSQYAVREDIIAATFPVVYTEGDGDWKVTVYDAKGF